MNLWRAETLKSDPPNQEPPLPPFLIPSRCTFPLVATCVISSNFSRSTKSNILGSALRLQIPIAFFFTISTDFFRIHNGKKLGDFVIFWLKSITSIHSTCCPCNVLDNVQCCVQYEIDAGERDCCGCRRRVHWICTARRRMPS
uniref:Uncharacterized protein n=1 Tax=Opuntia streptacantha TaxID=393608 RepID=A0A7C9DP90_OPUST